VLAIKKYRDAQGIDSEPFGQASTQAPQSMQSLSLMIAT
jgi:hypothetical protein